MAGLNQFVSFLSSQQPAEGARVRRWVTMMIMMMMMRWVTWMRQMVTLMTILVAAIMMTTIMG